MQKHWIYCSLAQSHWYMGYRMWHTWAWDIYGSWEVNLLNLEIDMSYGIQPWTWPWPTHLLLHHKVTHTLEGSTLQLLMFLIDVILHFGEYVLFQHAFPEGNKWNFMTWEKIRFIQWLLFIHNNIYSSHCQDISSLGTDYIGQIGHCLRADSRFAPSHGETSLQSNAVSHWLGANLESISMHHISSWFLKTIQYIKGETHSPDCAIYRC